MEMGDVNTDATPVHSRYITAVLYMSSDKLVFRN